jgi:hypothetical protein
LPILHYDYISFSPPSFPWQVACIPSPFSILHTLETFLNTPLNANDTFFILDIYLQDSIPDSPDILIKGLSKARYQ